MPTILPQQPGCIPKVAQQMVGLISGLGKDDGPHVASSSLKEGEVAGQDIRGSASGDVPRISRGVPGFQPSCKPAAIVWGPASEEAWA